MRKSRFSITKISIETATSASPTCIPATVQGSTNAKRIKEIVIQLDSLSDKNDEYVDIFMPDSIEVYSSSIAGEQVELK